MSAGKKRKKRKGLAESKGEEKGQNTDEKKTKKYRRGQEFMKEKGKKKQ